MTKQTKQEETPTESAPPQAEELETLWPSNLYQRRLKVMESVRYIQKEEMKKELGYAYVSHDVVIAKVRPFLVKHGLDIIPTMEDVKTEVFEQQTRTGVRVLINATVKMGFKLVNVEDPKDTETVHFWGQGMDPMDKAIGKACTYATKYALLKLFHIETGEDEESKHDYEGVERRARAVVTVDQVIEMRGIIDKMPDLTDGAVATAYGAETLEEIPQDRFQEVIYRLNQRLGRMSKPQEMAQ